MGHFLFIFLNVILPIFIQVFLGYGLNRKFQLNLQTLTRIQLYIIIPALLFVKIYEAELAEGVILSVALHSVLLIVCLIVVSRILAGIFKFPKQMQGAFTNSVSIYNSGNYCIPLVQLLYNHPVAFSVQVIIMMVHNIATNTIGIFNSGLGKGSYKRAIAEIFKVPMIYSVFLAFLLKSLHVPIWEPLWSSMDLLAQGLVPLALITLGAQLSNSKVRFMDYKPILATATRLMISPLIAYGLIRILGLDGMIGQVCVIAAAAPTAVNVILLAIQYDSEPEFCSQTVFLTTIISAITVSLTVFLAVNYI